MAYLKDPREMAIHVESGMGMTLEMDNRWETMYHWGAMVLDLCDMPISEYMKPGFGPGSGDSEYDEYQLTFMNGDVIISQTMVKFQQKIVYPSMEDYTDESGVTWTFIWDDTSYNGLPMPSMDLVITGQYVVKPEIAIYYGSFVVPVSGFNSEDVNQYFNASEVSDTFQSVPVKDCIGKSVPIGVEIPPYEEFNSLSIVGYQKERKNYYSPLAFMFPASVVSEHNISVTDIIGIDWWNKYIKPDKTVVYNGDEYFFCVQMTDGLRPARKKQTLNYNLKIE